MENQKFIIVVKGHKLQATVKAAQYGINADILKATEDETWLIAWTTLETLTAWYSYDTGITRKPGSLLFFNRVNPERHHNA